MREMRENVGTPISNHNFMREDAEILEGGHLNFSPLAFKASHSL